MGDWLEVSTMWNALVLLGKLLSLLCRSRFEMACRAIAAEHQLEVLTRDTRKKRRPKLKQSDRNLWIFLRRVWPDWRSAPRIFKADTVVGWHRKGFKAYWRRKSKSGRNPIKPAIQEAIKLVDKANPLWGAPHIHGEVETNGALVAQSTVSTYMTEHPDTRPRQNWRTFFKNHINDIAAMDMFTVPSVRFKVLFVLVVVSLKRREILHLNVTTNPTSLWITQQLREAFPWDEAPKFIQRDRDGAYGELVKGWLKRAGIKQVVSARKAPWQSGYAERAIGSIRRECTDHIIPWNENHLRRVRVEYKDYY